MDFLKSLMLYMSLTFATSMQAAPAPSVTPEPTATPYVIETPAPESETVMPAVTAVLTTEQITPTSTVVPDPTITPNKAYKKITMGQRGEEVTKLQNRLIELGYLAEGQADGAFGYQTRNAVIAFQKANGLVADGTPASATLTHLYEDPDVKENPNRPTPAPSPSESPVPTITPNKSYKVVKMGQKGDDVLKLQRRLIELGYLAEGSDDGSFGYQTRNAVVAFQKVNGLTADGTPGDATLTHLYENPDVKENPDKASAATEAPQTDNTIAPPQEQATEEPSNRTALPQARIVVNDAALTLYQQQDGVTVSSNPRVYQLEDGRIQLSLADLALSMEGWSLNQDGELLAMDASGYVVTLLRIGGRYSCVVDGQSIALAEDDVTMENDEPWVTADFLQKALGAEVQWVGEENALLVRLQPKTQSAD